MGLIKNAINFGNGFNIGAVAPIDSRMRVELLSDLTSVWTAEIPAYKGMIVTVMETSDVYVLKDVDNYTNIASWVKLGAADAATTDTANALKEAKEYTDALANGSVKTNTDAIATLNGDAETNGSVAKAVATETARAEAKELELNNAIAAETAARKAAINALDADVTSTGGSHVTVNVTEENGVITAVNVTESDIASASATTDAINTEKARAEAAESGLTADIEAETARATQAEAALAGRVQSIEADYLKAADKTELNNAITAETAAREAAVQGVQDAVDAIEADYLKAADKTELNNAITTETAAREAAINALDADVTSTGGSHVTVNVTEENGVITAVNVTESDIASASATTADIAAINEKIGEVAEGKTVVGMIADAQTAASDVDAKVNTLIGDDANMSARAIVQDEVLKQLESENISDSFDTLKEMAEYLSSHPQSVTEMNTAINNNANAITAETAAREAAVQGVQDAVDAIEADYLKAADKTELNNAIAAETAAREAADQAINNKIGEVETGKTLVEMIEAAEAAAIAAATVVADDSEFVTIEQTGEVGKTQTYTIKTQDIASASATTESIAAETKARTDADAALDGRLDVIEGGGEGSIKKTVADEKARAEAAEKVNADAIAAEKTRAEGAESGLSGRLDVIEADYLKAADKTELNNAITAEKTRAEGVESGLSGRLDVIEADYLKAADKTELNNAITAEKTRAEGVESGLENRLATVEGDYVKSVEAAEGSTITVSETEQKVTLSLQWGTF